MSETETEHPNDVCEACGTNRGGRVRKHRKPVPMIYDFARCAWVCSLTRIAWWTDERAHARDVRLAGGAS